MKFVPEGLSRKFHGQVLSLKANRPHITFGLGVAGVLAGNVLAIRATIKAVPVLEDFQAEVEDVKKHRDEDDPQRSRDLLYVYGKNSVKLARLYGPSLVVTGLAIGSLTGSHVEMHRRNKALGAIVVGMTQAFDAYRERVRAELGEDAEAAIYYGAREVETTDEDGKKIKELQTVGDPSGLSPYARIFDEYSRYWSRDHQINAMFIRQAQTYANQRLQSHGHVFLSEVYDSLGIPRTPESIVVGWLYEGDGDGYIDFGIYSTNDNGFVNGPNKSVLLDFNVDGVIYDKIG